MKESMNQQQPHFDQTQPYVSMSKKSNKKLILTILGIIAIILIILVVYFSFSSKEIDSRFVGEWEANLGMGQTANLKFNSDGTGESGYNSMYEFNFKWYVEENKLHRKFDDGSKGSWNFEFQDGNNKLTLKDLPELGDMTFIRK